MGSFNFLPRSITKYAVICKKKKKKRKKYIISRLPAYINLYIRTNQFVHIVMTTEILMHMNQETVYGTMEKWMKMTLGSI